ncbi:hypothetical protein A3D76_06110 [Candidatus Roizmanbacteria bacterium RIFCSPHIGHO2_02_FULL_37_9b]|nr:MAG: hypothetical protein A3D76_06110 [Candidatus Roizmanbacteria bacterium RIFCSPHIGHO2_02_FULL_37_9b]
MQNNQIKGKMVYRFLFTSKKSLLIVVALLSLLAGTIFFLREMRKRSRAAPGIPTLFYSVEPATVQSGQNFDLVLKVNPNGASFFAFELYTIYDPTLVEFQNNANLSQNITSSYILVKSSVDTTNNIINITGLRTGSAFTGSANLEIARVKMKVKSGVLGDINFFWDGNSKLGSNINKETLNGLFTIGAAPSVTSTPAPSGPDLHVDIPSLATPPGVSAIVQRGQNVDVQVLLKTDNIPVKSVDFILSYDDARLTFRNLTDLAQNIEIDPNSGFNTQFVIKKVDTAAKKIIFALVAPVVNQAPVPIKSPNDILLATIRFVVKLDAPDGEIILLPDTTSTIYNLQTQNILACTGGFRFTVGQAPLPTDTPFPTDTPYQPFPTDTPYIYPTTPPTITYIPSGVAMTLDLKLKFQGILGRPNRSNTVPVKVTVSSAGMSTPQSISANFSVDNNGIWSGSVYFASLLEAPDYKILVKGPMHLQKRVCDSGPSEGAPGSYFCQDGKIQLQAGTNYLDFSGIHLLAGDIPQQDGLVNSYDVSFIRNNLGKTDPILLAQGDLNFDGIIDTQDHSLAIAALAIRTDDEL